MLGERMLGKNTFDSWKRDAGEVLGEAWVESFFNRINSPSIEEIAEESQGKYRFPRQMAERIIGILTDDWTELGLRKFLMAHLGIREIYKGVTDIIDGEDGIRFFSTCGLTTAVDRKIHLRAGDENVTDESMTTVVGAIALFLARNPYGADGIIVYGCQIAIKDPKRCDSLTVLPARYFRPNSKGLLVFKEGNPPEQFQGGKIALT